MTELGCASSTVCILQRCIWLSLEEPQDRARSEKIAQDIESGCVLKCVQPHEDLVSEHACQEVALQGAKLAIWPAWPVVCKEKLDRPFLISDYSREVDLGQQSTQRPMSRSLEAPEPDTCTF